MSTLTDQQICENCLYWVAVAANDKLGECRRKSPVYRKGLDGFGGYFPTTSPTDWCGKREGIQARDMAEVKRQFDVGAKIEVRAAKWRNGDVRWMPATLPSWNSELYEYRVMLDTPLTEEE